MRNFSHAIKLSCARLVREVPKITLRMADVVGDVTTILCRVKEGVFIIIYFVDLKRDLLFIISTINEFIKFMKRFLNLFEMTRIFVTFFFTLY